MSVKVGGREDRGIVKAYAFEGVIEVTRKEGGKRIWGGWWGSAQGRRIGRQRL